MKKFTLKTYEGSWRILAILLIIIFAFSLIAQAIITKGYSIQITTVNYDVRNGDLNMEVYKPANASSDNKLPCMIISHGGSESLAANSLNAWELAKRGFVVINVSAYSCGYSDQPAVNDDGTREENYFRGGSQGLYDALQYARSIAYVDDTRIGMWGHSAGYFCITSALQVDGEYFTLNDRMLNVLYNEFGIEITEEQLMENADDIAKSVLSAEELAVYNFRKTEEQGIIDKYVKAARCTEYFVESPVMVAGHEVMRMPQTNYMIAYGTHEGATGSYYMGETDQFKALFHTGEENVQRNVYYSMADYTMDPAATSTIIGPLYETNISNSPEFVNAIDNGLLRIYMSPETFHNGMLWDWRAIQTTMEFYTQVLGYNNGDIGEAGSAPVASNDLGSGYLALGLMTCVFIASIGALIALLSILLKTKFFAGIIKNTYEPKLTTKDTGFYLAIIFAFIASFFGVWLTSLEDLGFSISNATATKWLPWEPGQIRTFLMIMGTAAVGLALFIILALVTRKSKSGSIAKVSDVNLGCGWNTLGKSVLLVLILFSAIYVLSAFLKIFFDARLLVADGSLDLMKPYGFMRTLKYALILLPATLIISTLNNLWGLKNVSDTQDTIINVVFTSLGAEVCILIACIGTYATPQSAVVFALHCLLSTIIYAPVMSYIYRKCYKITGSVWVGAMLVAIILGWRLASYISHQFIYWGPNELQAFWGFY